MNCTYKTSRPERQSVYLPHFGNIVNEFFNTAVGDVIQKGDRKYFTNPATNVVSFEDRFELHLALPGFTKKDIVIEVDNDLLSISAKESKSQKAINYRLREFNYANFKKTFTLPKTIDCKKINASFELGILKVVLNKKKESMPQPARKITIK